ncbi:putative DNA polymerase III, subunits gamma and tau [Candidatus Zinderia insecticola CARI]|uniref:DNA polymerase III subunit gamma/tau n=1 Tax=Zinderia insecticola (strain CARI) TaxID=871271 RepID=E0TIZ0_ZINIC|nr:putative DNA polymerase III, subunits gamma and tau [Candidatus Zinderia insecticola CARI]
MLVLKYRPMFFKEILGQKHIISFFKNCIKKKKFHNNFLFIGNSGIGKTSLSRILAKSMNCKNLNINEPCNKCKSCISINKDKCIDYLEINAASNRGINKIKNIFKYINYIPINKYKIYMIDEIHMLTNYAFDSILKIIEEPPKYVKFIFATTKPKKIPKTILSRCFIFNLKLIKNKEIFKNISKILKIENIKYEKNAIKLIAKNSLGSMRNALNLTEQLMYNKNNIIKIKNVQNILGILDFYYLINILKIIIIKKDKNKLIFFLNNLKKLNFSYSLFLKDLSVLLQKIFFIKEIKKNIYKKIKYEKDILKISRNIKKEEILILYQILLQGIKELRLDIDKYSCFCMVILKMFIFYPIIYNFY